MLQKFLRHIATKSLEEKNHVVIVGGGLIGTATAYYISLIKNTYVTLIESEGDVAKHTSFANAGRFCPQTLLVGSPASPHGVSTALQAILPDPLKSLLGGEDAKIPSAHLSVDLIYWGVWYLRNCTQKRFEKNRGSHHQLAYLADQEMKQLCSALPDLDKSMEKVEGNIFIYKDIAETSNAFKKYSSSISDGIKDMGSQRGWLQLERLQPRSITVQEILERFPEMVQWKQTENAPYDTCLKDQLLYCETDFTADARKFTVALAEAAKQTGRVDFRFYESVSGFETQGEGKDKTIVSVNTTSGSIKGDAVVVCCGLSTNEVIKDVSGMVLPLPLTGMRGCTVDLYGVKNCPSVCLTDYEAGGDLNFQVTPYKHGRVRITGFAKFDSKLEMPAEEKRHLLSLLLTHLHKVLPEMTYESSSDLWTGLRPMSPDNLPLIGTLNTAPTNLLLNCGHGPIGWTLAAASATVITDLVTKNINASDVSLSLQQSLSPNRFKPSSYFE